MVHRAKYTTNNQIMSIIALPRIGQKVWIDAGNCCICNRSSILAKDKKCWGRVRSVHERRRSPYVILKRHDYEKSKFPDFYPDRDFSELIPSVDIKTIIEKCVERCKI